MEIWSTWKSGTGAGKLPLAWLFLLTLLTAACMQTATTATLVAQVRDFDTGAPLPGVNIKQVGAEGQSAVTDATGKFVLTKLGERITLDLWTGGREPLNRTLRLAPGEERMIDFFMVRPGGVLPDDTLLFERGDHVWRVDTAGVQALDLTSDLPGAHRSPTWNGNRTEFAFIQRIPTRTQVLTRHPDGSPSRTIVDVPDSASQLRWALDGRQMVYTHAAHHPDRGLVTELSWLDSYTGVQKELVGGAEERDAAWSRDSKWIAWARRFRGRTWEIWITTPIGGAPRPVITGLNAMEPAFSPDGKRVAFASNREGNWDLYESAIEAPRPRKLTSMPANGFARRPLYSPIGDEVLFESNSRDGKTQAAVDLYALNMRTGRVHQVIDDGRSAAW